jgi:ABC-type multidrug transport system permease subunit
MNEVPGGYAQWRAAEESERDDDADWAFRTVFQSAMLEQPVSAAFTAQTMAAIVAAAADDARRARRVRAGMLTVAAVASTAAVYFGAGWAVSLVSAALIGLMNVLIAAAVRGAVGVQTGAGVWSVVAGLGRAAAALAADPGVTFALIVISAVAIAALFTLQRLLGSDGEFFQ